MIISFMAILAEIEIYTKNTFIKISKNSFIIIATKTSLIMKQGLLFTFIFFIIKLLQYIRVP
jgi:hypothetical protein